MTAMLADPQVWLAFISLALLEVVLGIDNLIFLSVLVGRLPLARQRAGRLTGLTLAMLTRVALLFSVVWLTRLVRPWFYVAAHPITGRDLILLAGGGFLVVKSALEIRETLAGAGEATRSLPRARSRFVPTVIQIALIDIVFSLDSVFTAVGLAKDLPVMIAAIVASMLAMMSVAAAVGRLIERHPTIKVQALAFLVLIGVALIAEAAHAEIPTGYLYFAMGFSVAVEILNIRLRMRMDSGKEPTDARGK